MPVRVKRPAVAPASGKVGPVQVHATGGAALAWRALAGLALIPVMLMMVVKAAVTGRRRHWWTPLWWTAGIAACVPWWLPFGPVLLLTGAVIRGKGGRLGGHLMSLREWRLFGGALMLGGLWLLVQPALPWRVSAALLAAAMLTCAVPWWQGRRIRPAAPAPEPPPYLIEAWPTVVLDSPELAGHWQSWDPAANAGVLVLDRGRADDVARLSKRVEMVLKTRPGAIRMRPDPDQDATVDHLVVQYLPNPLVRATRIDYADAATIDDKGRLLLGTTTDERDWHLPVWRDGGAAHIVITGATGSGKGGTLGLIVSAMARDPRVWVCALDLKGGSGIPALRDGVDLYGRTKDEWRLGLEIVHAITLARQERYGRLGLDRWAPTDDPLVALVIDESFRLRRELPAKALEALELISAQGRSLGVSQVLTTQRGDAQSLISATNRSNLMGGGTALMHRPGDAMARILAAQDFQVDPDQLPKAAGWAFPLSGIDPHAAAVPVRVRHIPTNKDRADGKATPHGTVQEWMTKTARAHLHEDDAAVAARWDQAPAPAVDPRSLVTEPARPVPAQRHPDGGDGGDGGDGVPGPKRAGATRDPITPSPPSPHHPQTGEDPVSGRSRLLAELDDGPLSRAALADRTGLSRRRTSALLAAMEGESVTRNPDGLWRRIS